MSVAASDSRRDPQALLLQKADGLAVGNQLKEALDTYSAALRLGPVRPGQLGSLVDCVLLNYLSRGEGGATGQARVGGSNVTGQPGSHFECPGCRAFLSDPVTLLGCGHSYCGRCVKRGLWSRCRLCGEEATLPAGARRANVLLSQLAEKWFPSEVSRARAKERAGDLLQERDYEEALRAVDELLISEPSDGRLRLYRAEAHAGLQQFRAAIEELDAVHAQLPSWPEVYFKKANVMHGMGCIDESLQLLLQCLALDKDFAPAKADVEKILCDLLSPVPGNVKDGLRESAWTSPHVRSKTLVSGYQPREASSLLQSCMILNPVEKPVQDGGLKRVASAPLLSGLEMGALLKRKLSVSEQDLHVCGDGRNKHKKQGESSEGGNSSACCKVVPEKLIDAVDFECSLCMRLFLEPVTTPCGHTFCKACLERCLDHTPQCPLCKESLREYLANRKYCVTHLVEELILQYLPEEFSDRQKVYKEETEELSNLTKNVPIFVCTMAYPTVPCPLHVFEPRYRLMIRRCIETGTKQFGMCVSEPQKGFADYGCMLLIRNVHFLPDGRSVVDTIGGKRFRVLQRGMKDGYWIAHIEYLEDVKVEEEEELQALQVLHDKVYAQACSWFLNLRSRFRSQILQHFGSMPEREEDIQAIPNGPAWCWWLLAVLPVDPKYQLSVLSMTLLKDRLIKIQHILTYFSRDQSK